MPNQLLEMCLGSASCNFSNFWYVFHVLHVQDLSECFDLFGLLFFYTFCVRVTAEGEVGYGIVTVGITGR